MSQPVTDVVKESVARLRTAGAPGVLEQILSMVEIVNRTTEIHQAQIAALSARVRELEAGVSERGYSQ